MVPVCGCHVSLAPPGGEPEAGCGGICPGLHAEAVSVPELRGEAEASSAHQSGRTAPPRPVPETGEDQHLGAANKDPHTLCFLRSH